MKRRTKKGVNAASSSSNVKSSNVGRKSVGNEVGREKIMKPVNVIAPVGYSGTELSIRNPPVERVAVMEQDAGEFAGGVEVGPINGGTRVRSGELEERVEGRVERTQQTKVMLF